jgi:hypothetical protein
MHKPKENDIQLNQYTIQISYMALIKAVVKVMLLAVTGFAIYFALWKATIEEKVENNRIEIKRLDKEKVDWKTKDEWVRVSNYPNIAKLIDKEKKKITG